MTPIAISRFWDDWDIVETTASNVVVDSTGLLATCTAAALTERGYMRKYIPARPGERVRFSVLARRLSGEPQMSIDYPSSGTSKALVDIDSDEFLEYSIDYTVPYTTDETSDYLQCTVGVFTTPAGSCEIASPRVDVEGASQGFLRVWCAGLIRLDRVAGVTTASLNPNFVNTGILSLNWDGASTTLEVETLKSPASPLMFRPILSAEFTTDLLPGIVAKAGRYTPSSGIFDVRFSDGTNFVDINALMSDGETCYLSVWAMGI